MPSLVHTQCPHCGHKFRVDIAALQAPRQTILRGRGEEEDPEPHAYRVSCPQCGYVFKILYPPQHPAGGQDG